MLNNPLIIPKIKYSKLFLVLTLLFFSFSFLGWLGETISCTIYYGVLVDRGFVSLPFCPLYGSVPLIIYAVLRTPYTGIWGKLIKKSGNNTALKVFAYILVFILYAICSILVATAVEFITGLFLDKVMNVKMWDYSDYKYNLMGYVCPPFALLWGALITPAMATVFPLTVSLFNRINEKALFILAVMLIGITLCDFLFNVRYSLRHNAHLELAEPFKRYFNCF